MSCNMCGQCCRMIHLNERFHLLIQANGDHSEFDDISFCIENWEYIGESSNFDILSRITNRNKNSIDDVFYVYKCGHVTDDNKCSIHNEKPIVCSGYPYYGDKNLNSYPWPYPDCCYEKSYYELEMLKILKDYLLQFQTDNGSNASKVLVDSIKGEVDDRY